jgi:hypothetical protein
MDELLVSPEPHVGSGARPGGLDPPGDPTCDGQSGRAAGQHYRTHVRDVLTRLYPAAEFTTSLRPGQTTTGVP